MEPVDYQGRRASQRLTCPECQHDFFIAEGVWRNKYTDELWIFCPKCKVQVGGFVDWV